MQLIVRRGTDEIGASCLEVLADGKRLLFDAGLQLDDEKEALSPAVEEALASADALFVSHGHLDHCGLLDRIPSGLPVYMSEMVKRLADASLVFRGKAPLAFMPRFLVPGEQVHQGAISITPRLMDHSAPDALGFHVQSNGKGLFYTGDFRSHGRKAKAFEHLLRHPPRPLDAVVMEGTLLDGRTAAYPNETSVESAMLAAFREEQGLAYLVCSGQNIDRLVSGYRAALRAKRLFVVDLYTAWVLDVFGRTHASIPQMSWDGVRVLAHGRFAAHHYGKIMEQPDYFGDFTRRVYRQDTALRVEDLAESPGKYVVKTSMPLELIKAVGAATSTTVYSLWAGNLDRARNPRDAAQYEVLASLSGARLLRIHTSGHADIATLQRLNEKLQPKVLIPMHTEHKRWFPDFFKNALVLEDGQAYTL